MTVDIDLMETLAITKKHDTKKYFTLIRICNELRDAKETITKLKLISEYHRIYES